MKKILVLLVILISTTTLYSQNTSDLKGRAMDSTRKKPLAGASVYFISQSKDSTKLVGSADGKGAFELKDLKPGRYLLKISYIGYRNYTKYITLTGKDVNLGDIILTQTGITTNEVEVTAEAPIGQQKEDTTEFNANAFKTRPDASTEDLVKKMPGVTVETDGTVKAQGEQVKKVLVDGKPFFGGDDPTLALRNLPADVVDKVQVYDKMSEQAEFSGFDDGNTDKTMNIITKSFKRVGQFGKFSAGGGTDTRYNVGLNYNSFNGNERISLLGLTNNVNQQNFNFLDILGMMGGSQGQAISGVINRFGGGMARSFSPGMMGGGGGMGGPGGGGPGGGGLSNYFVGQLDGLSTTHALGLNYADNFNDVLDVSGSYFLNYTNNNNDGTTNRDYIYNPAEEQLYNQLSDKNTKNINHRLYGQVKWTIDTSNSIVDKPNVTIQSNNLYNTMVTGTTLKDLSPLNSSDNNYISNYLGLNFANELLLRHRFSTPGRTISLDINTSVNNKNGNSNLFADNMYYDTLGVATKDSINQQTKAPVNGYGLNMSLVYTEPLGTNGQMQVNYTGNYNKNNSDKRTLDFNLLNPNLGYDLIDSVLSNNFDNDYFTQKAGVGYRYKESNTLLTATLGYQRADLQSNELFPILANKFYRFDNFLPALLFNYKFSQRTNLRFNYRTSTNAPSISQLQDVVDNSNPLQISAGNPNLKQQYTHSLFTRFSSMGDNFTNIFMGFVSFNYRLNYITNSTLITQKDTTIQNNLLLPSGGQFSKPINMDGYWNVMSFFTYGFPLTFMKSNFSLNFGGQYSSSPSLVNNIKNISNAYNYNLMFVLSSNISEDLDFTVSARGI
ncbi:MAG: TonB-dependent receptor, partial [FCB group bacterium]